METELLEKHLELVIEANKVTNITRISSPEEGRILHIEDSLSGIKEVEESPKGLYGDLGSGAGFPGIPIAIKTGRKTILVESVGKKADLLNEFASELGLDNVSIYKGRIEDLAKEKTGEFSVLTARALSKLGSLAELASPLLSIGGRLICYKAHIEEEEIAHVKALDKKLGMRIVSDRDFYLSDEITYRRIVVLEKYKKAAIKLPRHVGFAQKKPL